MSTLAMVESTSARRELGIITTVIPKEREFVIDNLLVRIHWVIETILVDRPCPGHHLPFGPQTRNFKLTSSLLSPRWSLPFHDWEYRDATRVVSW